MKLIGKDGQQKKCPCCGEGLTTRDVINNGRQIVPFREGGDKDYLFLTHKKCKSTTVLTRPVSND